ncbi:MAG: T9SS type A sorting domain-containing protein, partial [Bacteroidales bacterium]|nr:T9SS type A sorting domain-containing protein [Bacteroidales bacterium]
KEIIPNFTSTGTWYEYWTGDSILVTDGSAPISLMEGEYRIYTPRQLPRPPFTGIENPYDQPHGEAMMVRFYPNPASGTLFVETGEKELDMVLFDQAGREIIHKKHFGEGTSNVDIGFLKSGIYIIRFTAPGKVPSTGKIVKY